MKETDLQRLYKNEVFTDTNGAILRFLILLSKEKVTLSALHGLFPEVTSEDFSICVRYLWDEGYIRLTDMIKGCKVDPDADYRETRITLTGAGIALLKGAKVNPAVSM